MDIRVLGRTSKEDNWQRREDQVIQYDECVLIQVGGIETDGMESVFFTKCVANAHLLNGKNQNMAKTQITFYPTYQHTQIPAMSVGHTL